MDDDDATQPMEEDTQPYPSEPEVIMEEPRVKRKAEEVALESGKVASLLLTTHGEIHLDESREPKEFTLTRKMGLDELVFVSAVSVDSDSVNFGVCQVQERSIQELVKAYVSNNWKPSMEQIIGPFRRVRNLDQ